MNEEKCYGEQQKIQGCAACDLREEWLDFLQGKGLDPRCESKMRRLFSPENFEALKSGETQLDPGPAILSL